MMHTSQPTDEPAARLESDTRPLGPGQPRPLSRQLKQLVSELDEQTLMSLAAYAAERAQNGPKSSRRLPI